MVYHILKGIDEGIPVLNKLIELIDFNAMQMNGLDECQRLFHGRGHAYEGYEHINIDWLSPIILITLYRETDEDWLKQLAETLRENIPACHSVQVQYRHQYQAPMKLLLGEDIAHTIVRENGLQFNIQLGTSQNTGLFLDMRNGREWVRSHALDKNVLNLFAYTCAFSVAALAGGARRVLNVDNNKSVLSKGRENHRLNQQDTTRVRFEGVDIFRSFSRIKKHGPYDLMVCDPPSFQKGSVDIRRDYKKIIRRIPQFMQPQGLLMLCLNSPDLDEAFLHDVIQQECADCHYIETINNPDVFKEAMLGKGLKVQVFQYQ
ncbi:MAG: methyltransferase domain-containing protein [Gammaproteobacteria bacterium]|nr:methyltransferase domain-containing protein [Gammaproteobacteria bacterium]